MTDHQSIVDRIMKNNSSREFLSILLGTLKFCIGCALIYGLHSAMGSKAKFDAAYLSLYLILYLFISNTWRDLAPKDKQND